MSGPRKFSEKIALLYQKQEEGNAAFDSIMGQVKAIKPNNSGSQIDVNDTYTSTATHHSKIEESLNLNEQIKITYDNQQNTFMTQVPSHHKHKHKQDEQRKIDHLHPQQNQLIPNNTFLQLPNQTDSFRRALSDSSLNQTVLNNSNNVNNNNNNFVQNNFQIDYAPTYQQHQNVQNFNQIQFNQNNQQLYQTNYPLNNNFQSNYGAQNEFNDPLSASGSIQRNLSPGYSPLNQQLTSPIPSNLHQSSPLQLPINYQGDFIFSQSHNNHVPYLQTNVKPDLLISPNSNNNNLLNPNIGNPAGGSLPDLTAFQFQNNNSNQLNQNLQIPDYNQRHKNNYDLLQPNIHQHNHIGPLKPTHTGSVSPTRARYSPTHSNSSINRRPSPQRHLPPSLSPQSTPTSPLHPPVLEFTINSQQVNNYMNNMNMVSNGPNNGLYRNVSTGGANGESLPPSPQSQQSCFNSPQGSPGPLSISPQDLNPFTSSNNYDIMQKKFDSINLDSSNSFNQYLLNNSNGGLPHMPLNKNRNDNINDNKIDGDIGASNQSVLNSRNGSLSSSGSGSNLMNSASMFEEIQNLNSSFQHNSQGIKNNLINKTHKSSIPNIILTYPPDSIEEKNDIIISEINFDGQFDLDLQSLETVPIDESNFNEPPLFQNS